MHVDTTCEGRENKKKTVGYTINFTTDEVTDAVTVVGVKVGKASGVGGGGPTTPAAELICKKEAEIVPKWPDGPATFP